MADPTQNAAEIPEPGGPARGSRMFLVDTSFINWSGFLFAVLQSVCSAFIALSGVRLLIGFGAFAAATGVLRLADRLHVNVIRIPMMLLALAGCLLNLLALWRVWSLRKRPASAWRRVPVSARKKTSEFLQFALSVLTLLLLAAEVAAHHHLFGKW
jgi:hypothetical protein